MRSLLSDCFFALLTRAVRFWFGRQSESGFSAYQIYRASSAPPYAMMREDIHKQG